MYYFGFAARAKEHARKEAELREVAAVLARNPSIGADEFKRLLEEMALGVTRVQILSACGSSPAVVTIYRDVELLESMRRDQN
jgi:hypothetical protein